MIEARWLDALKLPLKIIVGIALGASLVLLADHFHLLILKDISPAAISVVAVVAIFCLYGVSAYETEFGW